MSRREIISLVEIKTLVNEFYGKVRKDELLRDIFNERIQDRWPEHLEKMYSFWQTVLINEHTYKGSPFLPHSSLPIESTHFHRWLELFHETIDEHFKGGKAEEAKKRAEMMATMFQYKLNHYQNSNSTPLK